jgi:uncharacterized protein (DUF302 family)
MSYYISKKIFASYEDAVARVKEQLKKEGFGILTEIDVKQTLKKKLDVDFRNYCILGACNPPFAYNALQAERNIGLLLPCNVIVQESEGGIVENLRNRSHCSHAENGQSST